jgi:hypothetical protein
MFGVYFACSALAMLATFGLDLPPETRLKMYFLIGLTVFGVFGSFTYYLPETLPHPPSRDRRRFLLQHRPHRRGGGTIPGRRNRRTRNRHGHRHAVLGGIHPGAGLLALPWIVETKGRTLAD